MVKKIERRQFSDQFKTKLVKGIVRDFEAGRHVSLAEIGGRINVNQSILRRWARDPRYGGSKNLFRKHGGSRKKVVLSRLPTNSRPGSATRAKRLVATKFECPHCGGPIIPPER